MLHVVFCIVFLVIYKHVSCSGSITLVWEVRAIFYFYLCGFCSGGSSSLWCLGRAALFYRGISWSFHIIILTDKKEFLSRQPGSSGHNLDINTAAVHANNANWFHKRFSFR